MSCTTQYVEINADWGTTITSPEFFTVNEELPDGITLKAVEDGITAGKYTLQSLSGYTFKAYLKRDFMSPLMLDMQVTVTDNRLTFTVPYTDSRTWPNKEQELLFDIQRYDADAGTVDIWVKGKLLVQPVITDFDPAA